MKSEPVSIPVVDGTVSGLWSAPTGAEAALAIAHGAGAGMNQPFLGSIAAGLVERGFAVLRYQFPYMEAGRSRPDPPARAAAAVRAAVVRAGELAPGLPLLAGGKSFGGRMTSTAAAEAPLPGVVGIFFLGFPLHAPGRPSHDRAAHLSDVAVPLLFLQGTRDDFAQLALLRPVVESLGPRATLRLYDGADHSFKTAKGAERGSDEVRAQLLDDLAAWVARIVRRQ